MITFYMDSIQAEDSDGNRGKENEKKNLREMRAVNKTWYMKGSIT